MDDSKKHKYEVSPHLARFNTPMNEFISLNPEYWAFVVGAYIFSTGKKPEYYNNTAQSPSSTDATTTSSSGSSSVSVSAPITQEITEPRILLLQRSQFDSFGGLWEGPGGSCENTDITILESLAREVLEETGLHVSRVRELAAIDVWHRRDNSDPDKSKDKRAAARFLFIVDVHEADSEVQLSVDGAAQDDGKSRGWENNITISPEHQRYEWATEEDVRRYLEEAKEGQPLKFLPENGQDFLKGFEMFNSLQASSTS